MEPPIAAGRPWRCRGCQVVVGWLHPDGGLQLTQGRIIVVYPERVIVACDRCGRRFSRRLSDGAVYARPDDGAS